MALVFCDGCDSYSSTADILSKWDLANSPWAYHATAGRNGGGAIQCVNGNAAILRSRAAIMAGPTENCAAFWIKVSTTPSAIADLYYAANTVEGTSGRVRVDTSGRINFVNSANTILQTGSTNICDNAWHWVEMDMEHAAASSSTMVCYVDTLQQFSTATGTLTALAIDHINFQAGPGFAACTITLDDIIIWENTAGGPVLSSFPLGPRQVTTLRPDADNTQTFTRSAGSTNYSLVNEQAYDGNTTYVQSGVSGDQDLYEYGTFAIDPATITAVMLNSVLINPNPGTINFQNACKSTSTSLGTSTITPSTYSVKQTAYPTDPNTGSAWTPNNLAAAQFGIKVV